MTHPDPLGLTGLVIDEKYSVEQCVGEGGFAVVYRATHQIWNKPVAIKLFNGLSQAPLDQRDGLLEAFVQEGALLTQLSSQTAGIVQARDVGAYTSPHGHWLPFIVLEWLEGKVLEDVLEQDRARQLPWSLAETLGFLRRVLPALAVAHSAGIAHRDIKPANLFVLGSAARSIATPIKLLDFGVAKLVSDHQHLNPSSARTGVAISSFTPQYGAPEQFTRSYGATGPWTDVYALALVATEMLTGRAALEGTDMVQLGFSSSHPEHRPTPQQRGANIPRQVQSIFNKALALNPENRFSNAQEFLQALEALESASISSHAAAPVSDFPSSIPSRRRKPREGILGVLLVLTIAAGGGFLVYSVSDQDRARVTREKLVAAAHSAKDIATRLGVPASAFVPPPVTSDGTDILPANAGLARACPSGMTLVTVDELQPVACLDSTPVLVEQYEGCVAAGSCSERTKPRAEHKPKGKSANDEPEACAVGDETPVNCVSAEQARSYCRAQAKRLPTELERRQASGLTPGLEGEWTRSAEPTAVGATFTPHVFWETPKPPSAGGEGDPSSAVGFRCATQAG